MDARLQRLSDEIVKLVKLVKLVKFPCKLIVTYLIVVRPSTPSRTLPRQV